MNKRQGGAFVARTSHKTVIDSFNAFWYYWGCFTGCGKKTEKVDPSSNNPRCRVGKLTWAVLWSRKLGILLSANRWLYKKWGACCSAACCCRMTKGEWIPDLAAEVPTLANGGISSDGLTVTYRLEAQPKMAGRSTYFGQGCTIHI